MAPLIEASQLLLDVMTHHFREAPENALGKPARHDLFCGARAEKKVTISRNDATRAGKIFFSGPDQLPDHCHRRARQCRAPNPNRRAVTDEGRRVFETDDLLAQRAVTFEEIVSKAVIGLDRV